MLVHSHILYAAFVLKMGVRLSVASTVVVHKKYIIICMLVYSHMLYAAFVLKMGVHLSVASTVVVTFGKWCVFY